MGGLGAGRRRSAAVAAMLCVALLGCGRIWYDPLRAGLDDGGAGEGGRVDGAVGDGSVPTGDGSPSSDGSPRPDASGMDGGGGPAGEPCRFLSTPSCPSGSPIIYGGFGISSVGGGTISTGDLLSGSCGGAGAEEGSHRIQTTMAGRHRFTITADYDTAVYVLADECSGAELLCQLGTAPGGPVFELDMVAGGVRTVVIDGQGDRCGNYNLQVERL